MHSWPPLQTAAFIARARTLVAKLCLKFKRLFQAATPSVSEEDLPPMEYKSAIIPAKKPACDHKHPKRKRGSKKEPCPHCGRPYGKQPEDLTQQYLREKREKKRAEREAREQAKIQQREALGLPPKVKPEKVKKEKPKEEAVEAYAYEVKVEKPKPYNVRCPKCKRLIKQPFEVVGDAAYEAAQRKTRAAAFESMRNQDGRTYELSLKTQNNYAWLLTLAVPQLKAADAALRDKPCFSNGQPIMIVVAWTPPPPHFVAPAEDDESGWIELRNYKKKERRLRALEKRHQRRKENRRELKEALESLPQRIKEINAERASGTTPNDPSDEDPPPGPRIRKL